eukprot:TRINITY_DN22832_c0_g1_i1.p1 TRINITY_DN22832_c0_g1~~TRINITY_DN22832_c0_g1_i1.p1  ORF type:complete len:241 (-),score=72.62 TRINITY_DN22832_c0_g1_i1:608-1330(-)
MSRGGDRNITVFSSEGRLYQIEYALRASKTGDLTSVGVCGKDVVAMVCQKKVFDKLVDPSSITRMFAITPTIGCVVTGLMADGKYQVQKAREIASDFEHDNGYEIPIPLLAERIADLNQVYTQKAARRPMAVTMVIGGLDIEDGSQLFKIDLAGHFAGFKAVSAGSKEVPAMKFLEKKVKVANMNEKKAVETAILCLQNTLSTDFKPSDIEVAVIKKDERFRVLSEDEVEVYLSEIAERD